MDNKNHLTGKEVTQFKAGHKGGPGRPPKLKTQVKDWIKEHPYAVAALMQVLYEKGIDGDRECAMYVIDRIKGKPKATIGMDAEDKGLVSMALIMEFRKMVDNKQLEEGYVDGTVIEEGTSQDTDAEDA